ncbi:MAG: DUF2156 domain-containing protein [Polyangiaceae bacterium]|nr:DUF2156 domain-containing protein [Polyangiaceae bacterium]
MKAHDAAGMPGEIRSAANAASCDVSSSPGLFDGSSAVFELVTRFGGASSYVAADPSCDRFTARGVEGLIPYREGPRCRVAFGDPVCHPDAVDALAEHFRSECAKDGRTVIYAAAGEAFARRCVDRGYAAIEFGEEIVLDPSHDRLSGADGRELRKKVRRAEREGVTVREHIAQDARLIEVAMRGVAEAWLGAKRGPQACIAPIRGFAPSTSRRWFYAASSSRMLGVVSLVRMDARNGWVIEHLFHHPDAPPGTSEILLTRVLDVIAEEGATHVTFGTAPLAALGRVYGVAPMQAVGARLVFDTAAKLFGLHGIGRFREKFGVAKREPTFLLFSPSVSALATYGLVRAFNAR